MNEQRTQPGSAQKKKTKWKIMAWKHVLCIIEIHEIVFRACKDDNDVLLASLYGNKTS